MGSLPKGISGSRAAAILGLGEYEGQTPFTAWQMICEERKPGFNRERGYLLPGPPDNSAIRFGTAFEDAIVELASAARGKPIGDREGTYAVGPSGNTYDEAGSDYTPDELYITCHIDGRYNPDHLIGPAGWNLHEGKTTNLWSFRELWGPPGTDRVPQTYQVQTQHQMLCTGASECIVSVLVFPRRTDEWEAEGIVPKNEGGWYLWREPAMNGAIRDWANVMAQMGLFHQYPVPASPSLQAMLIDGYRHFWDHYVLPEREPEIDCYADLRRAFPAPVGTLVVTEQEESWLSEYRMIGEEISPSGRLGRRREELKTLVLKSARSRAASAVPDEESGDKLIFRDGTGRKVGSFDGKTFR